MENDSKNSIGQRRELAGCVAQKEPWKRGKEAENGQRRELEGRAAQQQLWKKWIGTYGE